MENFPLFCYGFCCFWGVNSIYAHTDVNISPTYPTNDTILSVRAYSIVRRKASLLVYVNRTKRVFEEKGIISIHTLCECVCVWDFLFLFMKKNTTLFLKYLKPIEENDRESGRETTTWCQNHMSEGSAILENAVTAIQQTHQPSSVCTRKNKRFYLYFHVQFFCFLVCLTISNYTVQNKQSNGDRREEENEIVTLLYILYTIRWASAFKDDPHQTSKKSIGFCLSFFFAIIIYTHTNISLYFQNAASIHRDIARDGKNVWKTCKQFRFAYIRVWNPLEMLFQYVSFACSYLKYWKWFSIFLCAPLQAHKREIQ